MKSKNRLKNAGAAEYPVDFTYDSYGQMTQLKTYRQSMSAPDITMWIYDTATGLLTFKVYSDNKQVGYTYTADGKLLTRTWSRGLSTTYGYNNLTGELLSINYSDTTPDISFTYDRSGRQKTVTDVVGTRTFSYNSALQLTSEAISGIYSKELARSYDSMGRYSGVNIGTEYDIDYAYDTYGRFSTLTHGSDAFTYGYLANSNLISTLTGPNNISTTNTYETNRNLITSIENKFDTTTVSKYDYVNDALGRRTSMGKTGSAFSQNDTINYGYNARSEVTSAVASKDVTYSYGYNFDYIGNRLTSTLAGTSTSYTSNNLNQYTGAGFLSPTYDNDGNILTNDDRYYTWDAENRLITTEKSSQKLEFSYDYAGRRIEKKVYDKIGSVWTLSKHLRFVYDGYKLIEEFDALNSNAALKKFVWNGETPFSVYDVSLSVTYYYVLDANKNVSELLDSSGNVVAHYEYGPFGQLTKSSGSYADDNPFRFSSEYFDEETGLVYYNYRYYSPSLGRWLSRDPIEEQAGANLYAMVSNNPISKVDYLGNIGYFEGILASSTKLFKRLVIVGYRYYFKTFECKCVCSNGNCESGKWVLIKKDEFNDWGAYTEFKKEYYQLSTEDVATTSMNIGKSILNTIIGFDWPVTPFNTIETKIGEERWRENDDERPPDDDVKQRFLGGDQSCNCSNCDKGRKLEHYRREDKGEEPREWQDITPQLS